jgi:O-antigen/teichoic acid export membrane protein
MRWLNDYDARPKASRLKELIKSPLFYNAWYLLGVNFFPALAGFLFWTIASRLYPAAEIGIASVIISTVTLVSWIAGLGTNMGLIRFIPASESPGRLINSVLNLNILTSVICAAIFLLGMPLWAKSLQADLGSVFSIFVFIAFVIAATIGTTIRDSSVAYQRSNHAFIYTLTSNLLRIVLIFPVVRLGYLGLVGSATAAYWLAYFMSMFLLMPKVLPGFHWSPQLHWSDLKSLLPFSGGNYLATLIMQMTQTIIPLLTLNRLGADANAYSYITLMLGTLATGPGIALAMSAFAEGANDLHQWRRILSKAIPVAIVVTLFCSAILAIGAAYFLSWFGTTYADQGARLLRWMALAAPAVVVNQMFFTYLKLHKSMGLLIGLGLAAMLITLLTAYALMPVYGILANGIGVLAGNAVVSIVGITYWIRLNKLTG